MPYVILARHGETEANRVNDCERYYNGRKETPLTRKGEVQAQQLGQQLANDARLDIDLVASSPLNRAVSTAQIALAEFDCPPPMEIVDGFNARSLGEFEGLTRAEVSRRYPEYIDNPDRSQFDRHADQHAPGGESINMVTARAWQALLDCEARCHGDLLIVSHATIVRGLVGRLLAWDPSEVCSIKVPNAQAFIVARGGDTNWLPFSHLSPFETPDGVRFRLVDKLEPRPELRV